MGGRRYFFHSWVVVAAKTEGFFFFYFKYFIANYRTEVRFLFSDGEARVTENDGVGVAVFFVVLGKWNHCSEFEGIKVGNSLF